MGHTEPTADSPSFEDRWRAEMREHGIPEDQISELWEAGRSAGQRAGATAVLAEAHEMAVLAAVEAGTPEDCANAALVVVLHHLWAACVRWVCPNGCPDPKPAWWPAPLGGKTPPCSNCDAPLAAHKAEILAELDALREEVEARC